MSIFCPPATDAPGYAEENLAKPAAVRRAELRGGLLSADQVGAALCDQIDRDRFVLLPDSKSKLIAAAARLLPHRYWSRLIAVDLTGAGEALRSALARALSVCAMMASG